MGKRILIYLAGFAVGSLAGLLAAHFMHWPKFELWVVLLGNLCGILAMARAQSIGKLPAPEDYYKPISLFPPPEREGKP